MFPWEIGIEGRRWTCEELSVRINAMSAGIWVVRGQMPWSKADCLTLLAMLLENVGTQAAVRLGCPSSMAMTLSSTFVTC